MNTNIRLKKKKKNYIDNGRSDDIYGMRMELLQKVKWEKFIHIQFLRYEQIEQYAYGL